jgi:predicted PurR-regulated permease PerM
VRGTVTGVIYGILGTGLAQGVLAAIGFAIAGGARRRAAGLWPPSSSRWCRWGRRWSGAARRSGCSRAARRAGRPSSSAWGFFLVSTVDNVIKPFIISRGASLPFAVVFLGVLGGVAGLSA